MQLPRASVADPGRGSAATVKDGTRVIETHSGIAWQR